VAVLRSGMHQAAAGHHPCPGAACWEQAVAGELVGHGQATSSSGTTIPESGTYSPDACSNSSRFRAGCFPKHKQLKHFCYISLHK